MAGYQTHKNNPGKEGKRRKRAEQKKRVKTDNNQIKEKLRFCSDTPNSGEAWIHFKENYVYK